MSQPRSVNRAVLDFKRLTDADAHAELEKLEVVECGYTPPLPRHHHYDNVTGMHKWLGRGCSLRDDQYWIKHPGAASKAASAAGPPSWTQSGSVSGPI